MLLSFPKGAFSYTRYTRELAHEKNQTISYRVLPLKQIKFWEIAVKDSDL